MLIRTYKEWSFQLFPTFAFEDVVSKANKFGSKSVVKIKLDDMRLTECQRYMREVLGVEYQSTPLYNDSDEEISANDTTAEDISPPRNAVDDLFASGNGACCCQENIISTLIYLSDRSQWSFPIAGAAGRCRVAGDGC
jgi:hypothetical protein